MDQANFIGGLFDLRSELRDACRAVEGLRRKFVGTRPEDSAKTAPEQIPSVAVLITECRALAGILNKNLAEQHQIVGESPHDNPSAAGAGTRVYA